jgi:hypothetical protein
MIYNGLLIGVSHFPFFISEIITNKKAAELPRRLHVIFKNNNVPRTEFGC